MSFQLSESSRKIDSEFPCIYPFSLICDLQLGSHLVHLVDQRQLKIPQRCEVPILAKVYQTVLELPST